MAKPLDAFRYMTFDVVGTLIDFETGLASALEEIGRERGIEIDAEEALALYRNGRNSQDALRFPDDLARVYKAIAGSLGLPAEEALGARLRDSVRGWNAFPDSADALARLSTRYRLIAMTNAQRWAFEHFEATLSAPFHASFTVDDTGTEKPDPAFFHAVFAFVEAEGGSRDDILHVAQSQHHDIGVSRELGMTNCWIERRKGRPGYGGTPEPKAFTQPDHHYASMAELADAVDRQHSG